MITKFKVFEKVKEPEVDDYVLITLEKHDLKDALNHMIGQILEIDHNNNFGAYGIEFTNVLNLYSSYLVRAKRDEIRSFSKNKEQLELELKAEKYNL